MRHKRTSTPAYLIWVEQRPSNRGKGKVAYFAAVQQAARQVIGQPIAANDVEVEIVYSTGSKQAERMDTDNVTKPTLDALKGIAYIDDAQVRSVTAARFDRNGKHVVEGRVEHMGRLFYPSRPDVVLIMLYSDSRLAELGGEPEVQRGRYEAWQRDFDARLGRKGKRPA